MQIHLKLRRVANIIPPVTKVQEVQLTQRNRAMQRHEASKSTRWVTLTLQICKLFLFPLHQTFSSFPTRAKRDVR